jgi:hypothetical protein
MQSGADFIDRTIAALEGDYRLPDESRNRLLFAFTEYRANPGAQLDKLLGLQPGRGQCSIATSYRDQRCTQLYRDFYKVNYKDVKPTAAAKDIAFNLAELAENYDDPDVEQHYKDLYDEVMAVKGKVPKWRTIYNTL